ncbi:MAG TPA: DUF2339 domain-containing protein, partial [Caldilineaceae bacterium]|nr:DUF2339 domain-containing protein [Caldilineaceae bacterium]
MEFIATVAFCLTVPIGLAVLFLLFRTNGMKREFTRRLQQLEEQVQALQAGDRPTPALTSVAASATPPAAVTPAAVTPAMPELFPAPAMVAAEAHPPAAAVIAAEGREPAPASAMPVQTPARPRTPLSLPPPVRWFLERHLMVQLGVVILFIGVAFLLKYAADQGWLSLELRHVGAAAGGVLLALIGWRLRKQARVYGLALQGAGLGVIYLTTFFAYGIYGLIPGGLAFVLFVLLGVVCATAAVVNNAQILAFLAVVGAFLAPILASSGEGSHVALFSYYALVNAAILAIAWFRAWRLLNLAGFGFTLWAGLVWGSNAYEPALFASTEPFLVLFFLFYLAIAILYAIRQPREGETRQRPDPVDVTLVFGNPLAAFALQTFVVAHLPYGTAVSALTLALLYGVLALSMVRGILPVRQLLAECFLFLSFFFLALSVPLFFDARMTAATWAIGGAAWVWLGVRRQRFWTIGWGLVVQLGAAGAYGLV